MAECILLIIFGILRLIFPKYIRRYTVNEIGKKVSNEFIVCQRVTGLIFIIIAIVMFFEIK